jgi:hypothetical protein
MSYYIFYTYTSTTTYVNVKILCALCGKEINLHDGWVIDFDGKYYHYECYYKKYIR